jgi:hypothetical protein
MYKSPYCSHLKVAKNQNGCESNPWLDAWKEWQVARRHNIPLVNQIKSPSPFEDDNLLQAISLFARKNLSRLLIFLTSINQYQPFPIFFAICQDTE